MKSIAVIRADTEAKLDITIESISRKGLMNFEGDAVIIPPEYGDQILEEVMKTRVKTPCVASAMIPLLDHPVDAIGTLKRVHPPAHIVIVSTRHDIYSTLEKEIEEAVEVDFE